eukprot:gene17088-11463_t
MCRSCVEPDAENFDTAGSSSARAAAVLTFGPDAGNGAEIVHATQQQQQHPQRAEPLPSEIWLHILSFLMTNPVRMKGSMWPGIRDLGYFQGREGLTHKSPNVETDANGDPLRLRMLLKVDLAQANPPWGEEAYSRYK